MGITKLTQVEHTNCLLKMMSLNLNPDDPLLNSSKSHYNLARVRLVKTTFTCVNIAYTVLHPTYLEYQDRPFIFNKGNQVKFLYQQLQINYLLFAVR